ncbi:MAG: septum site-determining protein MinC [Anaerolineae bacterium]
MEEMALTLKGTQQGIVLRPLSDAWDDVLQGLENALQDAEAFFRGGRLIVEMGHQELTKEKLVSLRTILDRYDMELWAVLSDNEASIHTARTHGLRTRLPGETVGVLPKEKLAGDPAISDTASGARANVGEHVMVVQRTLRSGQSIKYPGHVILVGDVNPGAEVIAGGHIIVWGKMRGLAHAGALGDEDALICAIELTPAQLRIAGYIGRPPEGRRRKLLPETARVNEGTIVVEPWHTRE